MCAAILDAETEAIGENTHLILLKNRIIDFVDMMDQNAHCFQTIKATSIEESILNVVISLTTEDGQWISITLLWILISYLSQVFVPSPHGDFLVVILKILVGILNGPLVSKDRLLALSMIFVQAHSSGFTSLPFKVILNHSNNKLKNQKNAKNGMSTYLIL